MIMTLGLFQLENLMLVSAPFHLVDLRVMPVAVNSSRVQACLSRAHVVSASELKAHLEVFEVKKDFPVLLFCEDGRLSLSEAENLVREGYSQVYVVEGGTDGLLREADDFSSSGSMK